MDLLWLMLLLPLAGSFACGLLHFQALRARRSPGGRELSKLAAPIACAAMAGAFVVALIGFLRLDPADPAGGALQTSAWRWIDAGDVTFDLALWLDPLSATLALVVTFVGFLIHVYSAGYMAADRGFAKYFAYLNLFAAAMLVLVLSKNLLGLFVGWEGVGLCSYLLIGFWYEKGWPAEAGQKAFVMNRVGDACFLLGSFLLVRLFGTLDLQAVGAGVPALAAAHAGELALAALLLFGGACGKSAQIPLFTWLPDAMAGPTPVSALIHAATMVTAGVYLVVRLSPLFAATPAVLALVGTVGAATALLGATSALRQTDIKKVLAYSTVSQLGYMFVALGAGAWTAAVFHLVTHAFFKGLLFLGAGSVIHGMHGEQEMTRMGGLRKHMPRTWVTFLVGSAALSGLPLMSGFFSKDEILAATFGRGGFHVLLWGVGVLTAALTAFYTWRMVALTFHGEERFDAERVDPHESPASMTVPLYVLASLALVGGGLGLPVVLHLPHLMREWLLPVTAPADELLFHGHAPHLSTATEWSLLAAGALVALVFAHVGFRTYLGGPRPDARLAEKRPALAGFLSDAWGVDRAYGRLVVTPLRLLALGVATLIDQLLIDGAVNGAGAAAQGVAGRLRSLADGSVKSYAVWMGGGAAVLLLLWLTIY